MKLSSLFLFLPLILPIPVQAQVLDPQKLLEKETFWDNRDWDWYRKQIPFFDCPDSDLVTTYYYRWELITKHLTYGSPNSGYAFTEFIDRPFWSGTFGAISCPAGHQLYEVRWLKEPSIARDYARYWFRTEGAQPRRYSTWLADSVWAIHQVHPDDSFTKDLLPDLIKNYAGWEKTHFTKEIGLFWQTGHDDGMEININSRQTKDTVRGAPAYRPTLNSYLWADALAIARIADLSKEKNIAEAYRDKAKSLKENLQKKLWDPKRDFFFPMAKQDEERDGHTVKALSLTYQSGKFAGNPHGREEIGYVPWQFNLPDKGYEKAWKFLMDKDYFYAPFGPLTVERNDPLFQISKTCCVWSGNSWPYATTQTLKAMANLLQNYQQEIISKNDYLKLLQIYAKTHRKNDKPYIAEACHPDTGSWEGHDNYNHSEHYFHSGFCDLIITGLIGLKPRDDNQLEVYPLAPESWDYFALEDIPYRNHRIGIVWDKSGKHYGVEAGLHLYVDGRKVKSSGKLEPLKVALPIKEAPKTTSLREVNYAVNNDGWYYPRISASYTSPKSSIRNLNDGNYWYLLNPPNRWSCEGSPNPMDWVVVDFGIPRKIHTIKLYPLDDGERVLAPKQIDIELDEGGTWKPIRNLKRTPNLATSHRANVFQFSELSTNKVRVRLSHAEKGKSGLTELEIWGDAKLPVEPAPFPKGNLALNETGKGFPKVSASYTSRFDKVEYANDGKVNFDPSPNNRWTSYESPNKSDWLEVDLGTPKSIGRIELAIYDDRGGVRAPKSYTIQIWENNKWLDVRAQKKTPEVPVGGQFNEVRFSSIKTSKVRLVFEHQDKSKSGIAEVLIWSE